MRRSALLVVFLCALSSVPLTASSVSGPVAPHLAFDLAGAAGEWVVVRHNLSGGAGSPGFTALMEVSMQPSADGQGAVFALPPALLVPLGRGLGWHGAWPDLVPEDRLRSGSVAWDSGMPPEANGVALVAVVGATAAWTARIEVRFEAPDAPTDTTPDVVQRGDGLLVRQASSSGDPIGHAVLQEDLRGPGWSHLEILEDRTFRPSVREYDVRFPGGAAWDDPGPGLHAPSLGLNFDHPDSIGVTHDGAGQFRAEITHAGGTGSVRLVFASLPGISSALQDLTPSMYVTAQA